MSPSPRLHISFHLPPHFSDALYGKAAQKVLFYSFWVHFSLSCFPQLILIRYFSFQFIRSVMLDSLWPHESQHARPPCLSPTPGVHPNSCPLSQWCHQAISPSVILFFSNLQSFPASGSFQMSQHFASGGQSIGVSTSPSVLPMNIQDWFPLGWTGCEEEIHRAWTPS